jgi:hypothetical protein
MHPPKVSQWGDENAEILYTEQDLTNADISETEVE